MQRRETGIRSVGATSCHLSRGPFRLELSRSIALLSLPFSSESAAWVRLRLGPQLATARVVHVVAEAALPREQADAPPQAACLTR
jgi:hypothetical protein